MATTLPPVATAHQLPQRDEMETSLAAEERPSHAGVKFEENAEPEGTVTAQRREDFYDPSKDRVLLRRVPALRPLVELRGIEFHRHWPLEMLSHRLAMEREDEIVHLRKLFMLRIQNPYVSTTDLKFYQMTTGTEFEEDAEPMPRALSRVTEARHQPKGHVEGLPKPYDNDDYYVIPRFPATTSDPWTNQRRAKTAPPPPSRKREPPCPRPILLHHDHRHHPRRHPHESVFRRLSTPAAPRKAPEDEPKPARTVPPPGPEFFDRLATPRNRELKKDVKLIRTKPGKATAASEDGTEGEDDAVGELAQQKREPKPPTARRPSEEAIRRLSMPRVHPEPPVHAEVLVAMRGRRDPTVFERLTRPKRIVAPKVGKKRNRELTIKGMPEKNEDVAEPEDAQESNDDMRAGLDEATETPASQQPAVEGHTNMAAAEEPTAPLAPATAEHELLNTSAAQPRRTLSAEAGDRPELSEPAADVLGDDVVAPATAPHADEVSCRPAEPTSTEPEKTLASQAGELSSEQHGEKHEASVTDGGDGAGDAAAVRREELPAAMDVKQGASSEKHRPGQEAGEEAAVAEHQAEASFAAAAHMAQVDAVGPIHAADAEPRSSWVDAVAVDAAAPAAAAVVESSELNAAAVHVSPVANTETDAAKAREGDASAHKGVGAAAVESALAPNPSVDAVHVREDEGAKALEDFAAGTEMAADAAFGAGQTETHADGDASGGEVKEATRVEMEKGGDLVKGGVEAEVVGEATEELPAE
ncbi:hypothetical protein HK101_002014 [Irineochytrium annulatum]|nr:hypothetical protein HK101_002014 [Irineochytrium annulatum]